MMDILKIKGKSGTYDKQQADTIRMQNAYQKIIFKRMPLLPRLLQDFRVPKEKFAEFSFSKLRNIYDTSQRKPRKRKFKDYVSLFQNLENKPSTGNMLYPRRDSPDEGLFEEVRNDRLKAEIRAEFDIGVNKMSNISFLESTQQLVVSLGDRVIYESNINNDYTSNGNIKLINLLSVLYPNKEKYAAENIYTTIRINGQSIRSFLYTMNRLYGKDMSLEDIYLIYKAGTENKIKFNEFIYRITGKTVLNYGGSQSKLKKSVRIIRNEPIIDSELRKIFNKEYNKLQYLGLQDFEYKGLLWHTNFFELKEVILDEQKLNISFPDIPIVLNEFSKLPPRKLITRERQSKEKDFSVKFPVIELKINGFTVKMKVDSPALKDTIIISIFFKSEGLEKKVISNIKNNIETQAYSFRIPIRGIDFSSPSQRLASKYRIPSPEQVLERKFKNNEISQEEYIKQVVRLTDGKTRQAEKRKIMSNWRKTLRRKQFPHNLFYLKYDNKYLGLYSRSDAFILFEYPGLKKEK